MHATLILAASPWRFANPEWLALVALAPLALVAVWLRARSRREGLRRFLGDASANRVPGTAATWARASLVALAATCLAIAAARPQADPVTEQVSVRGRDLVFVIDVSRSMLSRDVVPDRLSRVKLWINDLVNTIGGDRVGLVAFAGVAVVKCPLTLDHGFFRMELDELSPASAPRGGTLIGDAIRKAMSDVFEPGQGRHRDLILFTDGEDQGSFPVEAAKAAGEAGIRIIAVGIGSELEGSLIPTDQQAGSRYVEHEGAQVRSRLDGTTLAAIAKAARDAGSQGVFLNVGTGTMDLDTVYRDLIASAEQAETSQLATVSYRELFPWFLAVAAVCLVAEWLTPFARRLRSSRGRSLTGSFVTASVLALVGPASSRADAAPPATAPSPTAPSPTATDMYNQGRQLFLDGKHAEAAERFRAADLATQDASLASKARYNLGQALYRQAMPAKDAQPTPGTQGIGADQQLSLLDAASRAFRAALEVDPADQDAARNVERCRRRMQEIREQQQQQQQQQQQGQPKASDDTQNQSQDSQGQGSSHDQRGKDLSDLAKQQRDAAEQTARAKESNEAGERRERTDQASKSQQKVNDATKQQQQSTQSPSDQAKDRLDQARKAQEQASDALKRGELDEARRQQEQAAEHLEAAAAAERDAAQREQKHDKQEGKSKANDSASRQPTYDQTASDLLDRERRLREARRQAFRAMRGKPQPVERDW